MSNTNFTITLVPGYVWQPGEPWTAAKANLAANPNINVSGSLSSASIADNSITLPKLQTGIFTADNAGRAPFATGWLNLALIGSGIFTADANGRAPFATNWLGDATGLAMIKAGIFTATPTGRGKFASGFLNAGLTMPDAYGYGTGGGTGSAYTVTFSPTLASYLTDAGAQAYTNYWDGLEFIFKAPASSSAAATLTESSLGIAKPIYRPDGTAIKAGDIVSGSLVCVRYNSTLGGGCWQMLTPVAQASSMQAGHLLASGTAGMSVTFTTAMPTASYEVLYSIQSESAGGAWTSPTISSKTVNGFTFTPPANIGVSTITYSWLAIFTG